MGSRALLLTLVLFGCAEAGRSDPAARVGSTDAAARDAVGPDATRGDAVPPDVDPDADVPEDGGFPADAGSPADAGLPNDAGFPADAEAPPDAAPDAAAPDTGAAFDAAAPDAATPRGCEGPPPPPPVPTDLAGLDLTLRGRVRAVYLTPSDRPFPPGLQERLDTWIRLAQAFFRDEMARWGYTRPSGEGLSFTFEQDARGRWPVVYLLGEHDAAWYQSHPTSPDAPGQAMAEMYARLPAAFHNDNVTLYFYDTATVAGGVLTHTGQGGSLAPWEGVGAGYVLQGAHFLGAGFTTVALDPADAAAQRCLFEQADPAGLLEWDEASSVYGPVSRGVFASVLVGASVHELGHAFGLVHIFTDTDGDGVENNLMGNGFRRFRGRYTPLGLQPATILSPESAAYLSTAPAFTP